MRLLVMLTLVACSSPTAPRETEDGDPTEGSEQPTVDVPDADGESANESVAEVSCNIWCLHTIEPELTPCGHWVGMDPMEWEECAVECCDRSNPVSAKPVTLRELARAAEQPSASRSISMLGGHRISPDCADVEWTPQPNDRERGVCPSGWVNLGDARAELTLEITRVTADPSVATAVLTLRAETPGNAWTAAMRVAVRAAWEEILGEMAIAEEMRPDQNRFELAGTRLVLSDEGARLSRITRNTPR